MDPKFLVTGPMSRFCSDLLPMYRVLAAKNVDKLQLDTKVGSYHPQISTESIKYNDFYGSPQIFQVSLSKLRFFFIEDFGTNILLSPVHPDLKNALNQVVHYIRETYDVPVKKVGNLYLPLKFNRKLKLPFIQVDLYEFSRASEMWYCKIKSIDAGPSFSRLMGDLKVRILKLAYNIVYKYFVILIFIDGCSSFSRAFQVLFWPIRSHSSGYYARFERQIYCS